MNEAKSAAYQAIGEYFCAFSALERELGEAVKVVLELQGHPAADFVVGALNDVARKGSLVKAAVCVAKNLDGSEASDQWKRKADETMGKIVGYNQSDRALLAHAYLEPQEDGSVKSTKHGQSKGAPRTWNLKELKDKIKQLRDVTEQLQKITAELSTLIITIPEDLPVMIWQVRALAGHR